MAGHGIVTRTRVIAGSALLVALSGTATAAHAVETGLQAATQDTATISVSASAEVSVIPDRARLSFAIETEAETAAEASQANAEVTTAAIAAVRPFLSSEGDLSTSNYSVSPVYSRDSERRRIGFRTTNALDIVMDDLEAVGRAIDAAIGAGANRVNGLTFFTADSRDAYLSALAEAVTRARMEAEVMAAASGGSLGRIVTLQSTRTGQPAPMMMSESLARADTPIAVGDQQVGASVRLVIQLLGR